MISGTYCHYRPTALHVAECPASYGSYTRPERLVVPVQDVSIAYLPSLAEVEFASRCILAALYLAGAPRGLDVPRRNWQNVLRLIRSEGASLRSASKLLARYGYTEESLALQTPGLLSWAEKQLGAKRILTAACPEYPERWKRSLGSGAPPALWMRGEMPPVPFHSVVGSRGISSQERGFAMDIASEAVRLGYAIVSGAAAGCDRAAAKGAVKKWKVESSICEILTPNTQHPTPLLEILPCGLAVRHERFAGCVLSPFAPDEGFSSANAMQRNALIYSISDAATIVHARFREGGTWRGAIEANRRRYCRFVVRQDGSAAAAALVALGAVPISSLVELEGALSAETGQRRMEFD